jgi:alginate O-acetyltransferase complex protein AlgI
MLFNSFSFLIFLPIVFILYWLVFSKTKSFQNIFLLIVSYIFYSFWDWRFSFLLAFSTLLDYSSGLLIDNALSHKKKKLWMRISLIINIGLLCYFKYFNFFIDSFSLALEALHLKIDTFTLQIILPVGISFYTFHGVSYVLDIYYGRIKSEKNIVDYSLFVSFFPLLVAGPIERATHLLPQLKQKKVFDFTKAFDGLKLIFWGLFKKVVIADSLAPIVSQIFNNYQNETGIHLIFGALAFAFQIYGDFSGYTDMARGIARLLGVDLILNFNSPYLSRSIPEFWSRWHISLSSWLNDYVFKSFALKYRNFGRFGLFISVMFTFLISGFWHGAGFNFILWGFYHGLLYLPVIYSSKGLKHMVQIKKENEIYSLNSLLQIVKTFALVCIGYILFRSPNLTSAIGYFKNILSSFSFRIFENFHFDYKKQMLIIVLCLILHIVEVNLLKRIKYSWQLAIFIIIIYISSLFAYDSAYQNFIYFQF